MGTPGILTGKMVVGLYTKTIDEQLTSVIVGLLE
jgi:hypothetical protein